MPEVIVKFAATFPDLTRSDLAEFIKQISPTNSNSQLTIIKQYVPELNSLVWVGPDDVQNDEAPVNYFIGKLTFDTDKYSLPMSEWKPDQKWDFSAGPAGQPPRKAWVVVRMITDRIFCAAVQKEGSALWKGISDKYKLDAYEKDDFPDTDAGGTIGGGGWGGMQ